MALPLTSAYIPGLDREWHRLRAPGTWWSGPERVAIAAVARAAREGAEPPEADLPDAAVHAAARIATDPHVSASWVEALEDQGLDRRSYTEIIGVVARLGAVDTFLFGIGAPEQPLPDPAPGDPSLAVVDDAALRDGFVPTVGPASPTTALSCVAAEADALFDLHGVLYLSLADMADLAIEKDLSRAQIEFVAARASLINDCFY